MSLKSSNKMEGSRCELVFEVNSQDFQNEINKVYQKEKKNISIPGFRKGKASRKFIEKFYGEKIFYQGAIENLYESEMINAIESLDLEVIKDKTDFDVIKADDSGLEFKVVITIKPEVEVGEYKGLEIKSVSVDVTDEDVEKEIDKVKEKYARIVTVEDRSVKDGDIAVIDFKGFLDDKPFVGGEAQNYNLTIGSGAFIPGFEQQIIGHNTNDNFDIMVTFPENYQEKSLAGEEAKFEIVLHEIKEKELPKLDDEFVKDISEFDTVDEYKNDLKNKIQKDKEVAAERDVSEQVISKLAEIVKGDIPEAMYEERIDQQINRLASDLKNNGITLEDYMNFLGTTKHKLREEMRPTVETSVKGRLALEKIAALENVSVTDEELDKQIKEIAEMHKISTEKAQKIIDKKALKKDILANKTLDFVRDNAVIVD